MPGCFLTSSTWEFKVKTKFGHRLYLNLEFFKRLSHMAKSELRFSCVFIVSALVIALKHI